MTVYVYTGGAQVEVIAEGPAPDTTPPETTIVAGPANSTDTSATITFTGYDAEGPVTFEGRLDDEAFHPVVPPMVLSNLSVGQHTYEVRAVDAAGNVDGTPASVTWSVLPVPTGGAGTWMKYPCAYGNAAYPEAEYQSWYNLAYDSKRDVFYGMDWFGVVAKFSPVEQKWTKLTPNIGGGTHNRTFTYDPINDRLWIGEGTGSTMTGVNYFDQNSNAVIPHAMTAPRFGNESAAIYDPAGKRLIVFGGWGRAGLHTFALDPPASAMTPVSINGARPSWDPPTDGAAQRMTAWRSDLDTARDRIFFVDVDGSLWFLPLPALNAWQRVVPSGPVPPVHTQYVYDREHDCIVGWSAANAIAGGSTYLPPERETWVLPFATMTWEKVANAAAGDTVPGRTVYVGYSLCYDPVRKQVLLHTLAGAGNYDPSTWAYRRSL